LALIWYAEGRQRSSYLKRFRHRLPKRATRDIPIIFLAGNDPVELGLVASLNRPGSNRTGLAMLGVEIAGKRLELLHKALPASETIALLVGPVNPYNQAETRDMESAARSLGLCLLVFNVTADSEIAPVFAMVVEHQAGAILVGSSVIVDAKRDQILSLAARFALPTMFSNGGGGARAGALLSYSADLNEIFRQVGAYTSAAF
jgi:putative tryptophan/tyrosine transport system substrate-binding protein